ncbi:MAG: glycosyltransferase [Elusimicrobiaceae bacterium]|nr:glycosyltransferase [Elusimicrobiaceae bacterium]
MAQTSLLSVIVPIYNIAAYLPRCLDSILAQTYTNLEIILVDDGSTDDCPQICDEYAKKDTRIKVVHQKNQGVSVARNTGLDNSTGEYISFVDPDDWLDKEALAQLLSATYQTGADLSWGDFVYVYDKKTHKRPQPVQYPETSKTAVFSAEEFICAISPRSDFGVWNKLFARELIGKTRFNPQYKQGEDLAFLTALFSRLHQAAYVDKILYFYYQRPASAQHAGGILRHQYNSQIGENAYKTCQQCGFEKALPHLLGVWLLSTALYGAYLLLLDTANQYEKQLYEVVALFQKHRKFIFTTPYIWQPAKSCLCVWVLFPTSVRVFCRLPGINYLLQKALARQIGANKTA